MKLVAPWAMGPRRCSPRIALIRCLRGVGPTGVWSSTRPENQPWGTRSVGRIAHHRHSCSGPQLPAGALEPETTPRSNTDRYIGSNARRSPRAFIRRAGIRCAEARSRLVGHANAAPAGVFGPPEGAADAGFEDGRVVIGSATRSHRADGRTEPPALHRPRFKRRRQSLKTRPPGGGTGLPTGE